jgi:uncharacterized repeat protein (TIGR04138 family)
MTKKNSSVRNLLREDKRFRLEAYQFVSESLAFAQDVLHLGAAGNSTSVSEKPQTGERHLTGQQLCEAIRELAIDQFGYMATEVLRSWGVQSTSDFGDIVFNLIRIGKLKKSDDDRREDFDDVYEFDQVFRRDFRMTHVPVRVSK